LYSVLLFSVVSWKKYSIFNPQYEAGFRIQLVRAMCLPEICGLGDTKCVNVIVKNNPPTGGESEN
jgi:hypothetical protein